METKSNQPAPKGKLISCPYRPYLLVFSPFWAQVFPNLWLALVGLLQVRLIVAGSDLRPLFGFWN
ncbi:MAG: hypothetical protein JRI59_11240 [Deltaproteobacteria bacterium]|nr:hypothetical protein [Deltaproteobacteria bacterium]